MPQQQPWFMQQQVGRGANLPTQETEELNRAWESGDMGSLFDEPLPARRYGSSGDGPSQSKLRENLMLQQMEQVYQQA